MNGIFQVLLLVSFVASLGHNATEYSITLPYLEILHSLQTHTVISQLTLYAWIFHPVARKLTKV